MSNQTQIERNAVNAVRDYVDATDCLRSYLEANDKTPLWDGHVFVFNGAPDKKENLFGTLRAQIKGTEVESFLSVEHYRLPVSEMRLYMLEGGLFFFVVEMLESSKTQRKIFYKRLTPQYIKAILSQSKGNQSVELTLPPLPTDYHIVEDEMLNFIRDSRKQVSFADKPGLSLAEAMRGGYRLKAEGVAYSAGNTSLAMLLTSQKFTLYQESPFASIPVNNVELTTKVTEHIPDAVSIGGVTYFQGYSLCYALKTVTTNIGDCFVVTSPKNGYENSIQTNVEVIYPRTGGIKQALHVANFLVALKNSCEITLGTQTIELHMDGIREELFKNADFNYMVCRDIAAQWEQMQIPGEFSFDDFDEKGLQQYLDIVQHVYRKEEGRPNNPLEGVEVYYSPMPAGKLILLLRFSLLNNGLYASEDAFATPFVFEKGKPYPLLTVALEKSKDVLFDNIHYDEQLECYRRCLNDNKDFKAVVQHDVEEINRRLQKVEWPEKRAVIERMINGLKRLIEKKI